MTNSLELFFEDISLWGRYNVKKWCGNRKNWRRIKHIKARLEWEMYIVDINSIKL